VKLATYEYQHMTSCGLVTPDGLIDIPSHTEKMNKLHSVKEILIKGSKAFDVLQNLSANVQERLQMDQVCLKAPIPRPGKIIALAGNYKKHLEETAWQDKPFDDQSTSTNPWPFLMPPTVVTADGCTIPWPCYSHEVDYEVELAVFIGQTAQQVSPEEARVHIAGFSIANDISARSVTFKEGRKDRGRDVFFDWMMGKWSDGFMPLGPWLVTADEIANPHDLELKLTLNGQVRQQSSTSQMIFSVYDIVSFISHVMTREPGDVILTGTPHGVAAADGTYMQPGDTMVAEIQGIGTLTNTLGERPEEFYRAFIRP
jgi:2-keto-4-pentenoate hydratase/2-oxohepta-3-ene-1,7-dioic acid hydratase in catechol pathway